MKYWLFPVTEENWITINNTNVFGVSEKSKAIELVRLGDIIVFYVTKKGSKSLGGMIVGVYKTVSTWFREDRPLWADEIRDGIIKYPWRIRIEPVKLGVASYRRLADRLSFVEKKMYAHAYLMGTSNKFQETYTGRGFQDYS